MGLMKSINPYGRNGLIETGRGSIRAGGDIGERGLIAGDAATQIEGASQSILRRVHSRGQIHIGDWGRYCAV